MSQENVEMARQAYEAWNRDDLQWVLDRCAPDIEFRPNAGFPDWNEVYRGREGVQAWYRAWREAWEALSFRVEGIEDLDDQVLVLVSVSGKGKDSGVVVEERRAHLFENDMEGFCTRWQSFATWDEALDAVGLSE